MSLCAKVSELARGHDLHFSTIPISTSTHNTNNTSVVSRSAFYKTYNPVARYGSAHGTLLPLAHAIQTHFPSAHAFIVA